MNYWIVVVDNQPWAGQLFKGIEEWFPQYADGMDQAEQYRSVYNAQLAAHKLTTVYGISKDRIKVLQHLDTPVVISSGTFNWIQINN